MWRIVGMYVKENLERKLSNLRIKKWLDQGGE